MQQQAPANLRVAFHSVPRPPKLLNRGPLDIYVDGEKVGTTAEKIRVQAGQRLVKVSRGWLCSNSLPLEVKPGDDVLVEMTKSRISRWTRKAATLTSLLLVGLVGLGFYAGWWGHTLPVWLLLPIIWAVVLALPFSGSRMTLVSLAMQREAVLALAFKVWPFASFELREADTSGVATLGVLGQVDNEYFGGRRSGTVVVVDNRRMGIVQNPFMIAPGRHAIFLRETLGRSDAAVQEVAAGQDVVLHVRAKEPTRGRAIVARTTFTIASLVLFFALLFAVVKAALTLGPTKAAVHHEPGEWIFQWGMIGLIACVGLVVIGVLGFWFLGRNLRTLELTDECPQLGSPPPGEPDVNQVGHAPRA